MQSHLEQEDRIREVREELGSQSPLYELAGTRVFTLPDAYLLESPSDIQDKIFGQYESQNANPLKISPIASVCLYLVVLSVLFLIYIPVDTGINVQFAQNKIKFERVESSKVILDDALLQEMPENELLDAYQVALSEELTPETDSSYREQAYEDYLILHIDEHTLMQSLEP